MSKRDLVIVFFNGKNKSGATFGIDPKNCDIVFDGLITKTDLFFLCGKEVEVTIEWPDGKKVFVDAWFSNLEHVGDNGEYVWSEDGESFIVVKPADIFFYRCSLRITQSAMDDLIRFVESRDPQ